MSGRWHELRTRRVDCGQEASPRLETAIFSSVTLEQAAVKKQMWPISKERSYVA
jgi:hypothetical protein